MKTLLKTNPFLICLTFLLCFRITAMSYGQVVVSIDLAEAASPAAGGTLSVNIKISNGNGVAGYNLTVDFDTSALQYIEIKNSNYLPAGAFAAPPQVSGNRVTLAATSLSGAASAKSGTLATLKFRVVAAKASTLQLVEVILSDSAANPLAVGNVKEWCLDEYNAGFYAISPARNPLSGANSIRWILNNYKGINTSRVLRGGSWVGNATHVRVDRRERESPTYYRGFRCVRAVQ